MATGIELIAAERTRQVEQEGWTAWHDDQHDDGSMAAAGAVYALCAAEQVRGWDGSFSAKPELWPWTKKSFKPKDPIRNLVRAGALIAAELDRLQREASKGEQT